MDRRDFLRGAVGLMAVPAVFAASLRRLTAQTGEATGDMASDTVPLEKSDEEWRRLLTPEQYDVLRQEGTERAFTSPLDDEKRAGTFICAGCFLPLFESSTKYDSGTGWPSFYQSIEGRVGTSTDFRIGYPRTEYHCARCSGHQGHIFDDGPRPTGKRFCNNGVALSFVPEGEDLPELRS